MKSSFNCKDHTIFQPSLTKNSNHFFHITNISTFSFRSAYFVDRCFVSFDVIGQQSHLSVLTNIISLLQSGSRLFLSKSNKFISHPTDCNTFRKSIKKSLSNSVFFFIFCNFIVETISSAFNIFCKLFNDLICVLSCLVLLINRNILIY
ncbi:MAG: hypothetical protein WCG25_03635 [bacterium]